MTTTFDHDQRRLIQGVSTTSWLTAADAAMLLTVSISKLRTMAREGKIPAYRIGSSYRFNEQELMDWIEQQRITKK